MRKTIFILTITISLILLSSCSPKASQEIPTEIIPAPSAVPPKTSEGGVVVKPYIEVNDQAITNNQVTVASVGSEGPGWVVIQSDKNGAPDAILGYAPVIDGINEDVVVDIELTGVTNTLWAVLYTDTGAVGAFEYPGPDTPVYQNGTVIQQSFTVTMP